MSYETTYNDKVKISQEGNFASAMAEFGSLAGRIDNQFKSMVSASKQLSTQFQDVTKTAGMSARSMTDGARDSKRAIDSQRDSLRDMVTGIRGARDAFKDLAYRALGPIDAIAGKLESVGKVGLMAGAAAGVGFLAWGVGKLNNSLEQTRISLGAMLQASHFAPNITSGMEQAGGLMTRLRKDAASLPGTFEDLAGIYKTMAIPAFAAGMNPDQLRGMASKTMAFGTGVAGLQSDQVAREMAMLLEGRASHRNVLGLRLGFTGDDAKKLNAESGSQRVADITKRLDKYKDAIEEYKHSFQGLSTTLMSNVREFSATATGPLFNRIKATLEDMNSWFDKNHTWVMDWGKAIGEKLGGAFDWAKKKVLEWAPVVQTFIENAVAKLSSLFDKWGPELERVGEAVKGFLSDPKSMETIEKYVTMFAQLQMVRGGWAGGLVAHGLGMEGTAAAAIGGDVAGGALAGLQGLAGLKMLAVGAGGLGAGGAGFGAGLFTAAGACATLASSAGIAAAALSAYQLFDQEKGHNRHEIQRDVEATIYNQGYDAMRNLMGMVGFGDIKGKGHALTTDDIGAKVNAAKRSIDSGRTLLMETSSTYHKILLDLEAAGENQKVAELELAASANAAASALDRIGNAKAVAKVETDLQFTGGHHGITKEQWEAAAPGEKVRDSQGSWMQKRAMEKALWDKLPKHTGGGGVMKVEIVIASNQDPSRIARFTEQRLRTLSIHPRTGATQDSQNYSNGQ